MNEWMNEYRENLKVQFGCLIHSFGAKLANLNYQNKPIEINWTNRTRKKRTFSSSSIRVKNFFTFFFVPSIFTIHIKHIVWWFELKHAPSLVYSFSNERTMLRFVRLTFVHWFDFGLVIELNSVWFGLIWFD